MPRDWLGRLADLALPGRSLRRWTLSLLYVAPTDRVLDVDRDAMPAAPDGAFDKAHSLRGAQLDMATLAEARRALRVGGLVAVTVPARWHAPADLDALQSDLETRLVAAGFGQLRALRHRVGVGIALCVLGVRQADPPHAP